MEMNWVSSKEPPMDGRIVLVYWSGDMRGFDSREEDRIKLGRYNVVLKQWRPLGYNGNYNADISHWMPLPEAP